MKVLFCARDNLRQTPAGDTVQIQKTAAFLTAKGVQVDWEDATANYTDYDIIHLFSLSPIGQTYGSYMRAKRSGCKTVLSPIYWDLSRYYQYYNSTDRLFLWHRYQPFRKRIVDGCDMVYPSGQLEMKSLTQDIGQEVPFIVIHNGVDIRLWATEQEGGNQSFFPKDTSYILCAARICPRKNQLALATVCAALGKRLILAGPVNNRSYLEQCLRYQNVTYVGLQTPQVLSGLYQNASLHVLAGFAETPGLANMEAAVSGCAIVSTTEGDAAEYFLDMATYCDPYEERDIYHAVEHALTRTDQPRLRDHLLEQYGWARCLEPLYQSYVSLLS